jgi:uncharacterized protein YegL
VALDASQSMNDENKAEEAVQSLEGLIQELANPSNKNAFEGAVIKFSERATVVCPFKPVTALLGRLPRLDPGSFGAATNITSALQLARRLLQDSAQSVASGFRYVKPLTVLLTDGVHNHGPDPVAEAEALKAISDVLTVAFGTDADEEMLASIATEQLSVRCRNGAELRCYFAEVGRTLTVTRAAGMSVASALATDQQ